MKVNILNNSEIKILKEFRKLLEKNTRKELINYFDSNISNKLKIKEYKKSNKNENSIILHEIILLGLLLKDNELYKYIKDIINYNDFNDEANKKIANKIFNKINKGNKIGTTEIYNELNNDLVDLFKKVIETECNIDDTIRAIIDYANKIKIFKSKKRIEEILYLLKNENLSEGDVIKLKQEWKDLQQKKWCL